MKLNPCRSCGGEVQVIGHDGERVTLREYHSKACKLIVFFGKPFDFAQDRLVAIRELELITLQP